MIRSAPRPVTPPPAIADAVEPSAGSCRKIQRPILALFRCASQNISTVSGGFHHPTNFPHDIFRQALAVGRDNYFCGKICRAPRPPYKLYTRWFSDAEEAY